MRNISTEQVLIPLSQNEKSGKRRLETGGNLPIEVLHGIAAAQALRESSRRSHRMI